MELETSALHTNMLAYWVGWQDLTEKKSLICCSFDVANANSNRNSAFCFSMKGASLKNLHTVQFAGQQWHGMLNSIKPVSLERIQRLAKLVKGFRRLSYEERLRRLGVHSLNRCRLRGDLIAAYNVFAGGFNLDLGLTTSSVTTPSVTSFNRQLDSAWEKLFARVPWFIALVSPTLNNAIHLYIIPLYAIHTPYSLSFIMVLTLKLFCTIKPYLYVLIKALWGPLYLLTLLWII